MRSFLKIFVTVVVIACLFGSYLLYQPRPSGPAGASATPEVQPLRENKGDTIVSGGESGWVRQFDGTGHLSSRFRLEGWEPQQRGPIHVTRPEAELYFKGKNDARARVTITGVDGEVVAEGLPGAGQESPLDPKNIGAGPAGPMQPPSSGRLNDVVIRVFETDAAREPVLTLWTNNIVFDNETFRVSTETYTGPDGKAVPADQVAVRVEGRDFDFYGRGLTVRWNDVDQRLELLRIAHGDKLVVKNPGALSGSLFGGGGKKPSGGEAAAEAPASPLAPLWPMIASADPAAAGAALDAAGKKSGAAGRKKRKEKEAAEQPQTKPARKPQPPYRATFNSQVRILEGEQQVAKADVMNVDFLLGQDDDGKPARKSTTRPASRPATGPAQVPAVGGPATRSSAGEVAATGPAEVAATQATQATRPAGTRPTTSPVTQPITIYWVDDLTVTPSAASPMPKPLAPGDAGVELVGTRSPVELTRENSKVECARFAYRTDGTLSVEKSEKFPQIVLTHRAADAPGGAAADAARGPDAAAPAAAVRVPAETRVTTESVWYSFADRIATLKGPSRVLAPVNTGDDGTPGVIDAAWRDSATFHLLGDKQDELTVRLAEFAGDVDVKAPQGTVRAQQLAMEFDPPAPAAPAPKAKKPVENRGAAASTQPFGHSKQPDLRRVTATDKVFCEMTDPHEGRRTVACDRLELETARSDEGKLYPHVVDARGAVRASDATQELRAGHVVLRLKPSGAQLPADATDATGAGAGALNVAGVDEPAKEVEAGLEEPIASPEAVVSADPVASDPVASAEPAAATQAVDDAELDALIAEATAAARRKDDAGDKTAAVALDSLLATEAVQVTSRDGAVARGSQLSITTDGREANDPHVELSGEPARVVDAKNGTLVSRRIVVDPRSGVARVPGEGSLRAVQRDDKDPDKPGRPVEVAWADGAELSGAENRIDVTGKVVVRITDPNGTVRTATAGRVAVQLVDKTTGDGGAAAPDKGHAGADRESRAPKKTDNDAKAASGELAGAMGGGAFKDKDIGLVTLRDGAAVDSELLSADGKTVLQRFHLKADVIDYDVAARHLAVPGPGQMLVESRELKDEQEAKKKAKSKDDPQSVAIGDGTTAFQWAQRLEMEEAAGRASMDGSVVVNHQPDDKGEPALRIDADQLTADFAPESAADAAARPAGAAQAGGFGGMRVKSARATGNILISRAGAELAAGRIDFDPASHWVIARGSGRTPAVFSDPSGAGSATASELWLNTDTWQVKIIDAATRVGGASGKPR